MSLPAAFDVLALDVLALDVLALDVLALDVLASGLGWICWGAWRAMPLLALVLLVDLLLRRRIAARYHCLLWMLVAVRMMLPVTVASPLSLAGAWERPGAACTAWFESAWPGDDESERSPEGGGGLDDWGGRRANWSVVVAPSASLRGGPNDPYSRSAPTGSGWFGVSLAVVWALVAGWMLVIGGIRRWRFARLLGRLPDVADEQLDSLLGELCETLSLARRPRCKFVPGLSVPAVFGLWRVTVCLPPATLSTLSREELRWVLLHELGHVKRRDAWVMALAYGVRACHWFNPFAWLVVARLRTSIEQAADDVVTRGLTGRAAIGYGRLLLRYASSETSGSIRPGLGLLHIASARDLKRRIKMLNENHARHGRPARVAALLLLLLLAATGLTDAQSAPPEESRPLPASRAAWAVLPSPGTGDSVATEDRAETPRLMVFDVRDVLARIRREEPEADAELYLRTLPGSWGRNARVANNRLYVEVDSAASAERIQRLLKAIAASGLRQFSCELRMATADLHLVEGIDWSRNVVELEESGEGVPGGALGVRLSPRQTRRLLARWNEASGNGSGMEVRMAPKVTLFNGQTAEIRSVVQRPFVVGISSDDRRQPEIRVVGEGMRWELYGAVTSDGKRISFETDLHESQIADVTLSRRPVRDKLGRLRNATVQVPHLVHSKIRFSETLRDGQSILLAAPTELKKGGPDAEGPSKFYLITLRLLDE